MKSSSKHLLCLTLMALVLVTFFLATALMMLHYEPFLTWYYSFAWWSYIIFFETFLYDRRGKSLLYDTPKEFLTLLVLSITLWLIFEAFNLRLQNWHYVNLPSAFYVRWFGYTISFATVLPAIFTTLNLLRYFTLFHRSHCRPWHCTKTLCYSSVGFGLAFIALPIAAPKYFFPLVWLAFIFLLEPINYRLAPSRSLIADLERGNPRKVYLLLSSGLICGILWELWNYFPGSKWIYTIPLLGWFKIFEMPVLGYLGFPPFALECYVMTTTFFALLDTIGKNGADRRKMHRFLLYSMVVFDIVVYIGIDQLTVVSFK